MTARVLPAAIALVLAVSGCVSDEKKLTTVSSSPFGSPSKVQPARAMHSPATEKVALRVSELGRKIVAANPRIGRQVAFSTLGDPQPEIFHRSERDNSLIFITEGLVNQCKTDGELAAVLCQELGKMDSEQAALTRPKRNLPERPPLMSPRIGNDPAGSFGSADIADQMVLARFEKERRQAPQPATPPPAPEQLARLYLQNAGFNAKDLDTVAPLLRRAEQNDTWEQQMTGKLGR